MSNENDSNVCIISGLVELLKLDIIFCKANVYVNRYIWSFSENSETNFMMRKFYFGSRYVK